MTYNGYTATIRFDPDAEVLHGEVVGLRDVITFQATCVEDLENEFRASVDDYLAWCEQLGQKPERAYSGRLLVRMAPDLHRDLASAAQSTGTSINALVVTAIEEKIERDRPRPDENRRPDDEGGIAEASRPATLGTSWGTRPTGEVQRVGRSSPSRLR